MTEREIAEFFKATLTVKRNLYLKLSEQEIDKIKSSEYSGKAKAFSEMIIEAENFGCLFLKQEKEKE